MLRICFGCAEDMFIPRTWHRMMLSHVIKKESYRIIKYKSNFEWNFDPYVGATTYPQHVLSTCRRVFAIRQQCSI